VYRSGRGDRQKSQGTSVRIACLLFEIWTQDIQNMKHRTLSTETYDQTISWVAGIARNKFIRVLLNFRMFNQLHMVFTTE